MASEPIGSLRVTLGMDSAAFESNANRAANQLGRLSKASKAAAFQQRNLQFQLFDVAQSLALGMNPMMVAMQQGPQIAQIWGSGRAGVQRNRQDRANTCNQVRSFTGRARGARGWVSTVTLEHARGFGRDGYVRRYV